MLEIAKPAMTGKLFSFLDQIIVVFEVRFLKIVIKFVVTGKTIVANSF